MELSKLGTVVAAYSQVLNLPLKQLWPNNSGQPGKVSFKDRSLLENSKTNYEGKEMQSNTGSDVTGYFTAQQQNYAQEQCQYHNVGKIHRPYDRMYGLKNKESHVVVELMQQLMS